MTPQIFFSGKFINGYSTFPVTMSEITQRLFSSPIEEFTKEEFFKFYGTDSSVLYAYRRNDILSDKQASRPGSSFIIWAKFENIEINDFTVAYEDYFRAIFNVIESDKHGLLEFNSQANKYYFTNSSFTQTKDKWDQIKNGAIKLYNTRFNSNAGQENLVRLKKNGESGRIAYYPKKVSTDINTKTTETAPELDNTQYKRRSSTGSLDIFHGELKVLDKKIENLSNAVHWLRLYFLGSILIGIFTFIGFYQYYNKSWPFDPIRLTEPPQPSPKPTTPSSPVAQGRKEKKTIIINPNNYIKEVSGTIKYWSLYDVPDEDLISNSSVLKKEIKNEQEIIEVIADFVLEMQNLENAPLKGFTKAKLIEKINRNNSNDLPKLAKLIPEYKSTRKILNQFKDENSGKLNIFIAPLQ